ncbi:hypothetical protein Cni_G24197 [Canna indica]|uniref:Mce/MlaD domain-containing protein n=1 Tax=Canna indica TaxID=4628 RepID=A0AAQ3KZS0_9LILI|nr:hypothetical protein Cni_G24197 [Canna indica]
MIVSAISLLNPPILPLLGNAPNFPNPRRRFLPIKAASSPPDETPPSAKEKNRFAAVMEAPRALWRRTMQPLGDFGFGRRTLSEGGVGLFMVSGALLFALAIVWLRGVQLRSRLRKYQVVFEFSQACGICVGTPVRIRGTTVGSVVRVDSTLRSIDAVAEVEDDKIMIPRNSVVEVNQSGLLMETLIDITPQDPLLEPSVGPLHPDCIKEGLILCDKEKIRGKQGVSLDVLVGLFTRIGQEMDEIGVSKSYKLVEKVATVVEETQPLLAKIEALAEDIQPLLSGISDSTLMKDVESLTKSLARITEDLRKVQSTFISPDNAEMIRQSIFTLVFTLKNIESISSDISGFTSDEATRRNLKLLIKSLSRLL